MKRTAATAVIATALLLAVVFGAGAQQKLVDIELWAFGTVSEAGPPPDDWVAYKIIREKLGINLKVVLQPSSPTDQDTKVSVAGAANSLPDLFAANRDMFLKLAKQGLLAPTDKMYAMMPNRTSTHYDNPTRNKLVKVGGVSYGLADFGAMEKVEGVVIRKDWLDKLGLKVPRTLDELIAVAKAFTEKDPDGNGKNDTYGFGSIIESTGISNMGLGRRFDYMLGAFGVTGVFNLESADKFGFNFRDPNFRKAIEWVKKINDMKLIDPDWPTLKKDDFRARWKQGKFGIMWEQFAALHQLANYKDFDKNFPNGEWVPILPPLGPEGKSSNGVNQMNARIYAVSAKAAKAGKMEAIASLLEWMTTDEGYYLLGFGVEGINYKKDSKGFVSTDGIPTEQAYTDKSKAPLTQLRNMVFVNNDIELAARYVTYKSANGKTINPLATWKFFQDSPYTEGTASSLIDPPSNANDFKRYYDENLVGFVLGQQPLNDQTWATFVKGMDAIGAATYEKAQKAKLVESGLLD
jgi:putative aldouronate transport system substrate-binding protein